MPITNTDNLILLTGATGYVGSRLLKRLEAQSRRVRCMARNPERLKSRAAPGTEVVAGDVMDTDSLDNALRGVHTAFYLIHSMGDAGNFVVNDAASARNFAQAAARNGVRRIIYLGGLGESRSDLSKHLRSRHEVGDILRETGVPTTEFRASVIIGAGSLSFEIVRALVERVPVMIIPKWVSIPTQPIAVDDVLYYLSASLDQTGDENRIYEIGGDDVVSYGGLMRTYAEVRGLKRLMIPVPVLTPHLSSLWLGLVTPVYARVGRNLIEGVRNSTLVRDDSARRVFSLKPMSVRQAVAKALDDEDRRFDDLRLAAFFADRPSSPYWGGVRMGCRNLDTRTIRVSASPEKAYDVICCIGGENGYFGTDWLWRIRGLMDNVIGGVGLKRGRVCADHPRVGEVIDWWRVVQVEENRHLRLMAEMKLPGRAWLDFEVTPDGSGAVIRQTAVFDPKGLIGLIYWYTLVPAHAIVFGGMLREIAKRAMNDER